ncbi:Shedu immune nuclease family protein [Roseateles terrae]|uniref:Shedu protein SduA C-terminal domain-containing protein n=1 Tax=Roseateles terrae TaxID=431060 RepID=A0ABR6GUS5_9BURK|nr:Shedu immune nuclease family protein [Roseateles terrae]MBB3195857.1 hypothetical protein [Roseateles terrae]OWQ86786.1 hypothetical protein CDN98_13555 [Roseateles terrae]
MSNAEIHKNKRTDKTYISSRVDTVNGPLRIASKVFESEGIVHAREKGNVVLRRTPKARTEIVAKFLEADRMPSVVTIQAFSGTTGLPHQTHFSFVADEIPKLLTFFQNIAKVEFNGPGRVNISDAELERLVLSRDQASRLVHQNEALFSEIAQSELTKDDIVALGYRKKQLGVFHRLLSEPQFFEQAKTAKGIRGDEPLWQAFFEKNQWIFGYGLSYFFVTGFDGRKLEQVVKGYDLLSHGKRADGVMKTRGIINALCFVEIKHHNTPLLDPTPYRGGCYMPSRELSGAVAQVQGTVAAGMETLYGLIEPSHDDGTPTGERVYNYRPRAFVVVGSLAQLQGETGVNREKLRSFEAYRNSITGIEIITFDELYERSRFIVEAAALSPLQQSDA